MHEHHLTVRRTARYYTLGDEHGTAREIWIVCHGYGQLASRFLRHFAVLDDGSRVVVAPEALSRFYPTAAHDRVGASWMTREDRLSEIDNYVSYLDAVYEDVTRRLERGTLPCTALGFSQGGATVTRWATTGSTEVRRLLLWASPFPPDTNLTLHRDRLAKIDVDFAIGTSDEMVSIEAVEADARRLAEEGVRTAVRKFAAGHVIVPEVLKELSTEKR